MKNILLLEDQALGITGLSTGEFNWSELPASIIINLYKIQHLLDFKLILLTTEKDKDNCNALISFFGNQNITFAQCFSDLEKENKQNELKTFISPLSEINNVFFLAMSEKMISIGRKSDINFYSFEKDRITKNVAGCIDWDLIFQKINSSSRSSKIVRATSETHIKLELTIDGTGKSEIHTGIGFFDHMLDQLVRHSGINLKLDAKGDLHVDEHHTVEDTAIILGESLHKALGDKKGIERFGFFLPMDESVSHVALDFSGRPYLNWNVLFKREQIGDMPTELFEHFFRSFADNAKCTLYIKAEGENDHHKIEAVFKALGRAIRMAVSRDLWDDKIPSTKGVL